jgi:amino acid adenylation domain-containing protein
MDGLDGRIGALSPARRALLDQWLEDGIAAPTRIPRQQAPGSSRPSYGQEQLWLVDQLDPGAATYNSQASLRLEGPLDAGSLARSLSEIVRRHEALRTTYSIADGLLRQVVQAAGPVALPVTDLTERDQGVREHEAHGVAVREARRPFDLANGPVIRARLLRLADDDHVLLVMVHHIAFDGWSKGVFFRELSGLYNSFTCGRPSPLPELPLQYADYAAWERDLIDGPQGRTLSAYWRRRLDGAPEMLGLPTDQPRPARQRHRGAIERFELADDVVRGVDEASRRAGVTRFMVLLAAFQVLLHRYSGDRDIVIGVPVANRAATELEGLIGYFANMVAIRASMEGDPPFRELLERVKQAALGAYAHQAWPFERAVAEGRPARALSHMPLVQASIVLEDAPMAAPDLRSLIATPFEVDPGSAAFDLTLALYEQPEGLAGAFEFDIDLFERATIQRMAGHFATLVAGAAGDMSERLSRLPLLVEPERRRILEWSRSTRDASTASTIHGLFEDQVRRTPDAVAIVAADERVTYRDLNRRANQLAHRLRSLCVGPHRRVAICLERGIDLVTACLGTLKAGGAYLPLDPTYPPARLAFMAADSGATMLVTRSRLAAARGLDVAYTVCLDRDGERIAQEPETDPGTPSLPDDVAYIMYTSGSTGAPKGVIVPHRGVVRVTVGVEDEQLDRSTVMLQVASPSFDGSAWEIWGALLNGGRLVIFPAPTPDLVELARVLSEEHVTHLSLTPAHFNAVADENPSLLKPVKRLVLGGDVASAAHIRRVQRVVPELAIINSYGPTEAPIAATAYLVPPDLDESVTSVPIGRPVAGSRAYVLDAHLQPVPIGVPGELCIGGDGLALGYANRPDLTAEKFVADPFDAAGGCVYRTGDRARVRPDGHLEFLGRFDDQIKIRGFRIEPGEVEAALASHPAVDRAFVMATGELAHEKRLVAYVVGRRQATPETPHGLRRFLSTRLPDHMVPSSIVLVDALPLMPQGKIDRGRLPLPALDPGAGRDEERPSGPRELKLAAIWEDLLARTAIAATDNFFDVGGDSIAGARVLARIAIEFGVSLPLATLFEAPTIRELAVRLSHTSPDRSRDAVRESNGSSPGHAVEQASTSAARAGAERITRRGTGDPRVLSYQQEQLWLLDRLSPDAHAYAIPIFLSLDGPLDAGALECALAEILRRHEVLRTRFAFVEETLVPVLDPPHPVSLPILDLEGLAPADREAEARRIASAELARPFDLREGPLFRVRLLRLGNDQHRLIATVHHIAFDAWSSGVFCRELGTLYSAFASGQASPLPELPLQYSDFASWQDERFSSDTATALDGYWREQLADAPELLRLPTDRPRPARRSGRGAVAQVDFPPALVQALAELARTEAATPFMLLLAAFQLLLHRYTDSTDLVVGCPAADRPHPDLDLGIGLFVNILPMRVRLDGNPTCRELLARTKAAVLGAHAHAGMPFQRLVERLRPTRTPSHTPLVQVVFTQEHASASLPEMRGLAVRRLHVPSDSAKFDLTLSWVDEPQDQELWLEYSTDLFDPATIERMAGHFHALLRGIVADVGRPVSEVPLLTRTERDTMLVDWNRTAAPYPRRAIHQIFERQVDRTPAAVALVAGGERVTYQGLNARANRLARHLRRAGVDKGTIVGLHLERGADFVAAALATLKAGAAYLPLDTAHPPQRLAFMLRDTGATVTLTHSPLTGVLDASKKIFIDRAMDELDPPDDTNLAVDVGPEDLAYVMYTSGSTGSPKAVAVPHRAVVRLLVGVDYVALDPSRVLLQLAPTCFDASTFELWGALLHGARLVVFPPGSLDLTRLERVILEEGVTTLWLTTSLFNAIVDDRPQALAPVSQLLTGGERASVPHIRRALAHLPTTEIINGYGPTEATVFTCCHRVRRPLEESAPSIPIGRPIANARVYVLDRGREPVPVGIPGELYIGGDGLAGGYLHAPELTAEKFVRDPFSERDTDRLFRSGDQARYRPDGTIEFLGRLDRQVKIRGFRVEPAEIEAALASHPGVDRAVVVDQDDSTDARRLAAFVVPSSPGAVNEQTLRAFLAGRLPDYMLPPIIELRGTLPLTLHGKVDLAALQSPSGTVGTESGQEPAQDPLEHQIAGIWEQVLGIRPVSVTDNFFDLGGHSLAAARLFGRLADICGVDLPLATLFEAPTIRRLAALLRCKGWNPPWSSLVPLQPGGPRAPLFCIHGAGGNIVGYQELVRRLGRDRPIYGLQAVGLNGHAEPLYSIEAMAAHYVSEIRSLQAQGPYHLAGLSFGGAVAFEMARQLHAASQQVGVVALFDSLRPDYSRALPVVTRAGFESLVYLRRAAMHLRAIIGGPRRIDYVAAKARTAWRRLGERWWSLATAPYRLGRQPLPRSFRRVRQASKHAFHHYTAQPYAGSLTLFVASESASFFGFARDLGWAGVARGLEIHELPGNHVSMLKEPHVAALAARLTACLNASDAPDRGAR